MNRRERRRAERAAKKKKALIAKDKKSQTDKQNKRHIVQGSTPSKTFQSLQWLWKGLLATIAIVGFAYQFRLDINVDRDVSLNVHDPFATQFRVTNEGRLAIYDLAFSCTVNNSVMKDAVSGGNAGQEPVPVLASKESTTKSCSIKADSFPLLSDLFFDVTYRPEWYWQSLMKRTRFVNMRDSKGNLQWVKQPLNSN